MGVVCDNCPSDSYHYRLDSDEVGSGDTCGNDDENDGVLIQVLQSYEM